MQLVKILTIFNLFFSVQLWAVEPGHEHQLHNHKVVAAAKPNKKFIADADLKPRMETILQTMKEVHKNESKGDKNQFLGAGNKITATVQDIFKNCKLTPEADAAIHPILAEILQGAELLKNGQGKTGLDKIHNALLKYEDSFVHKGWKHNRAE